MNSHIEGTHTSISFRTQRARDARLRHARHETSASSDGRSSSFAPARLDPRFAHRDGSASATAASSSSSSRPQFKQAAAAAARVLGGVAAERVLSGRHDGKESERGAEEPHKAVELRPLAVVAAASKRARVLEQLPGAQST